MEIFFEEGTEFVQVHGIINIREEDQDHILLIVHYLKKVQKGRSDTIMPYDLFQYDLLWKWEIIEPSMILRPALMIPCFDRSEGYNTANYSSRSQNIRMWILPYHTIDVNGSNIKDVTEQELREMEEYFEEINNLENHHDESDSEVEENSEFSEY